MPRITNAQILEAINGINGRIDAIESRLDKVEAAKAAAKATSSKKTKSPAKTTKKVSNSEEFDRDLYEKTAKELGVFYKGRVVATVKDGEVKYTRAQNRARVYKKMGYTPKSSK